MTEKRQGSPAKGDRDARLKAALKANIARRKERARTLEGQPEPAPEEARPEAGAKED